jgi:dihydrofolate synthase / folylpolyglutamate synthase
MNFDEALKYLLSLGNETVAIKLGLSNITRLLDTLGSPHKDYQAIQIAGTNGKGSTAAMIDSICRRANIKTGLYTSPHLVSITERIKINGEEINKSRFAEIATKVREASIYLQLHTGTLPTFFEQITAIALEAFRDADISLAILETGMGGRLDATTAANANLVAITPIDLDHQQYLGSTIREIAAEKAAIIREGVRAIIAPQTQEAMEVIEKECKENYVKPAVVGEKMTIHQMEEFGRARVTIQTNEQIYKNILLGLRGRHQTINAAVAIGLAESLHKEGYPISFEAIIEGLEEVVHKGRLQLRIGTPSILFDGAHNQAGAYALSEYLREIIKKPVTIIFGAMQDKELSTIGAVLFPLAKDLILTEVKHPRAATIDQLRQIVPTAYQGKVIVAKSSLEALQRAREVTTPDSLICVTGSLYLVGELLEEEME